MELDQADEKLLPFFHGNKVLSSPPAPNAKDNLSMMHSKFICCKLYISESRNPTAIAAIDLAAKTDPQVAVLSKFEDSLYNRIRYTLVSYIIDDSSTGEVIYSPIRKVLLAMMEAAFSAINLKLHSGAHPRMGVNDDLSFHPLGQATMEDAASLAKQVASDIGNDFQVPVFLYAAAHPTGKSVGAIRRELGYYRPNHMGNQWSGTMLPDVLPIRPDEGPTNVSSERGATTVGATPFLEGYNVPVLSKDVATVRRITRSLTGRGGGLPTVQALALLHGDDCTEIACLLDPDHVSAYQVQTVVEQIAAEQGLEVEKGYFTDLTKDRMLDKYLKITDE
ncbi:formimidoyltransferase-cyclodeaminase-like [Panicum miliaceum]|uniref:Formimidoyltransferase-cyclodeaminase-like n=1 Tax=Panicum miliaceum TaxID=4540 RepID=A0A3L6TPZ7_PANMI|nr:formimidoyltransferase-cyclodeaminase-like [Panicum miliaceum]